MILLIIYVSVALGFSFLCSIAEAVLLSVTHAHIAILEQEGKASGKLLRQHKQDINKPLAAILTLNTIAHTIGAAGAGAQATAVFGNAYLGVFSAVLTLLILILSEIIPKTLGAYYWRSLAPSTAYALRFLIWLLYPFVILAEKLTGHLSHGPGLKGFNRHEFAAMANLSVEEGQLAQQESEILKNLLLLRETRARDAMTPRTVVFSVPDNMTVGDFFQQHHQVPFSRIPIYQETSKKIHGYVLCNDILLAQAQQDTDKALNNYHRPIHAILDSMSLSQTFDEFLRLKTHMMLVVDEYGSMKGIITLEDVLETLLGLDIIDESDKTEDLQELARNLWKQRAKKMGMEIEN